MQKQGAGAVSTISKFRWFWVWQDEQEEKWLEEMSASGYHLTSATFPGIYTFSKGNPDDYVYRLDYRRFTRTDKDEYLTLFSDSGWEYLGEMNSWHYFRKKKEAGTVNEIFTDGHSKISKYNRILSYTAIVYLALLSIIIQRVLIVPAEPWWGHIEIFLMVVIVLLTFAICKLAFRIKSIRKST